MPFCGISTFEAPPLLSVATVVSTRAAKRRCRSLLIASSLTTSSPSPVKRTNAEGTRRRRRTREDVVERIGEAARQLFSDRGYHGTTTREIARVADVSETLLFRYYGSKAALFDEVVCAPFRDIMRTFVEDWRDLPAADVRKRRQHAILLSVYELLEKNRTLFIAQLSARGRDDDEQGPLPFNSLLSFFREGTQEQQAIHARSGRDPGIDVALAVRIAFGMVAASIMFDDWLFPDGIPERDDIVRTLETMITRSLDLDASDDPQRTTGAGSAG